SLEGVFAFKIQALNDDPSRLRDLSDMLELLRITGGKLDLTEVRAYFRMFDREDLLDELLRITAEDRTWRPALAHARSRTAADVRGQLHRGPFRPVSAIAVSSGRTSAQPRDRRSPDPPKPSCALVDDLRLQGNWRAAA